LLAFLACLSAFLIYLAAERVALSRARERVPLRITVTGTRGKSGVARMLASVLTESGKKVLAKTTGSEPMLILPDRRELRIRRWGMPTIAEQIRLVRKASRLGAGCLVSEIMSLQPETHFFESQRILQPGMVALTNARLDHTELMGGTVDEIAAVLALDVSRESIVFIPENSFHPAFAEAVEQQKGSLIRVQAGEGRDYYDLQGSTPLFPENVDLVCSIARRLQVDEKCIARGIAKTRHDIGGLGIWQSAIDGRTWYLVNAFAANDPESTLAVLAQVRKRIGGNCEVAGILNLRADRGARTLQWIQALQSGTGNCFDQLYVTGAHAPVVTRKYPAARILKATAPEAMTAAVASGLRKGGIILGFGNIKGSGTRLVEHWSRSGTPYGV
jgi:gamma-polyglutamate synthase